MAKIGYMFSGQGAQFAGMGKKLAEANKAAADVFSCADKVLGYSISNLCFNATLEDLTPCAVCQPSIFTVSVACYEAYRELHPEAEASACAGLSLGEFSAACAAGILTFEDGLRLVAERGRLMDICCQKYPGKMTAVLGAEDAVIKEICDTCDVDVANLNCPGQVVISGAKENIEKANELLGKALVRAVPLTVAGAYHSRLMKPAADEFVKVLEKVELKPAARPFFQNVSGEASADSSVIKENLYRQIYSSVKWESCVRNLMAHSEALVECGPGSVLVGFMRRIQKGFPASVAFTEI